MLFQNILAVAPLLALVAASPISSIIPVVPIIVSGQGAKTPVGMSDMSDLRVLSTNVLSGVGSVVTGDGLKWYTSSLTVGNNGYADPNNYVCFKGIKENFPAFANWMNFATMFNLNQKAFLVHSDTGPEQGAIYDAILKVAAESKVDARLILAVIIQESGGNVHVGCTNNGIKNCGIMQAYTGSVSYNSADMVNSIVHMIRDGTEGTSSGPGFVQWISQNSQTQYAGATQGNPYQAARGYNSGSINFSNLSDGITATGSYVADLANRLQGWSGNNCGNAKWLACGYQNTGC